METRESQGRGRMPVYFTFLFSSEDIPIGHLEGFVKIFAFTIDFVFPKGHKKNRRQKAATGLRNRAFRGSFVVPSGLVLYFDVFKNDMLLSLYLYLTDVFVSMMALWRGARKA
jgi:hypothetical protein